MNGKKIIAATMLGMMAFGGAINVSATEGTAGPDFGNQPIIIPKKTEINAKIKLSNKLELIDVLKDMDFELQASKQGELSGEIKGNLGNIEVFSGNDQPWKVTAKLDNNELKQKNGKAFKVSSFKIGGAKDNGFEDIQLITTTGYNTATVLSGKNLFTTKRAFKGASITVKVTDGLNSKKDMTGTIRYNLQRVTATN